MDSIESTLKKYVAGKTKSEISKKADSTWVNGDEQIAIRTLLHAIKRVQSGLSAYTCIELFTDPTGKVEGIVRTNVCHMRVVDQIKENVI